MTWIFHQDTALERATNTFRVLDVNGDGELNEDEFVAGCQQVMTVSGLNINPGSFEIFSWFN